MARILDLTAAELGHDFAMGSLIGGALAVACLIGLAHFGIFPKQSGGNVLLTDYRLSRTEMQLREEIRYLEHELALLRRARSSIASFAGDPRS